MKIISNWLSNIPIRKKFIPLQLFVIINVVIISLFSFFSVSMLNNSSQNIIDENVRNKEALSAIIRNMYVCRVLGRDILFAVEEDVKKDYYDNYIAAFDDLDYKMDEFSNHLSGSQLVEFTRIIEEKNTYKDSMILSADIWIAGGDYDEALYALQVVTPIANEFFGSIDEFSAEEERLMNVELDRNDDLVVAIFAEGAIVCILCILGVTFFTRVFSKSMSKSLITLEKAMSQIAKTGNMKIEIPDNLYTKDEIGRIAEVANDMKSMLLQYSFQDTLTGGLNVKAYHEELRDMFADGAHEKEFWCIISDMNNLKLINDFLGHMEGDNALRNSYHALNNTFKMHGKTFRIGGDEFVSLLSGCSRSELEQMIANITKQIKQANTNEKYSFSLAFGFDQFSGKTLVQYNQFFKTVDKRMYANKLANSQSRMNARVVAPDKK